MLNVTVLVVSEEAWSARICTHVCFSDDDDDEGPREVAVYENTISGLGIDSTGSQWVSPGIYYQDQGAVERTYSLRLKG